ncbi:glycine cleavage H-protein-domain-containing protein [Crucibulum laeve]|uniref:Glycine cleavage system H protein n=1 Tax=Crucibulum laeve TaxID=68775 RepID=A0A5C3M8S2_9AGAR|nr:glycine cleavage H-protein-domain-containing protein [Crucibulum laeve]
MQSALRAVSRSRSSPLLKRHAILPIGALSRPYLFRTLVTKRYTVEHEAVVFDDSTGVGIVSITDHAQSVLGDVVFVELPTLGTEVAQGDQIGAVESVKAASDIYAPVSGTIEEINETLSSEPGLLNKSAEEKGWLCKIKLSNPSEIEKLLTEEAYKSSYEP